MVNIFKTLKREGLLYCLAYIRNYIHDEYLKAFIPDLIRYERKVELPFFSGIKHNGRTLQVGNVLKDPSFVTVDKYEKSPGVINQDILDFTTKQKFPIIISISTLEHIGLNENPKDPEKILKVIKHIKKNLLQKGGLFFFSVPIGYNKNLDKFIAEDKLDLFTSSFLERITLSNEWKKATKEKTLTKRYNYPYICANGLMIGVIKK